MESASDNHKIASCEALFIKKISKTQEKTAFSVFFASGPVEI